MTHEMARNRRVRRRTQVRSEQPDPSTTQVHHQPNSATRIGPPELPEASCSHVGHINPTHSLTIHAPLHPPTSSMPPPLPDWVSGFPVRSDATEHQILQFFSDSGIIPVEQIIRETDDNDPLGDRVIVKYTSHVDAQRAVNCLNGLLFYGQEMHAMLAPTMTQASHLMVGPENAVTILNWPHTMMMENIRHLLRNAGVTHTIAFRVALSGDQTMTKTTTVLYDTSQAVERALFIFDGLKISPRHGMLHAFKHPAWMQPRSANGINTDVMVHNPDSGPGAEATDTVLFTGLPANITRDVVFLQLNHGGQAAKTWVFEAEEGATSTIACVQYVSIGVARDARRDYAGRRIWGNGGIIGACFAQLPPM